MKKTFFTILFLVWRKPWFLKPRMKPTQKEAFSERNRGLLVLGASLILPVFMFVFLSATAAPVSAADCGPPPAPYPQCGAAAGACVGAPIPTNHTVIVTTTFDNDCNKVYGCEDKGVLPGQCGNPSAGQCNGSISFSGTCSAKSLSASWDVQNVYGSCNIYLRGGTRDEQISTSCSGSKTVTSFAGAPLTNNGIYELFVSNGDQNGNCYNQSKGRVTIPCASTPAPSRTPSPTSTPPGTRSCSVSWNLPNSNPAPNSGMTVEVTGISDTGGWQNIQLSRDNQNVCPQGAGCSLNIIQPGPKFIFSNVNSGSSGSHTLSFATDYGATRCPQTQTYTAGGGSSTTVSFRVAENPTDLSSAPWQNYSAEPMKIDFEFIKDKTPGNKFVWAEFKDSNGRTEKKNAQITLLGADPTITSCALSFEGSNTVLNLKGQNFGSTKGGIKSGDTSLQIREWKNDSIRAMWQNAPLGQILSVTLTNPSGQTAEGQCSSISQLALGAKVFCRSPSNHQTDNVDLALASEYEGGTRVKQKVSIDKDGIIQGLTQKLEGGRRYKLSLKAPKSLRKTTEFTAGDGVTIIPNFVLPVGDIFPADGGDRTINSLDKGELNRQWVISVDTTGRSGDFNRDSRVNSIDWACMRYDFGQVDDPEPTVPPPASSPSPSPSGSGVPTPTPIPTTTPVPTSTSTPAPTPTPTSQPRVCTVSWAFTPTSPPANSTMTIVVTGVNNPYGWLNIGLWRDGQEICRTEAECGFSVSDPPPVYTFTRVNAGSAGSHTLTFKTGYGSRICGPDQVYTVR